MTVTCTRGVHYELMESAMVEQDWKGFPHSGGRMVARHDLHMALVALPPLSKGTTKHKVSMFVYQGQYKMTYTVMISNRRLSIGCRIFDAVNTKKLAKWARGERQ